MALPHKYRLPKGYSETLKQERSDFYSTTPNFTFKYYKGNDLFFLVIIRKFDVSKASHRNLIKRRIHGFILDNLGVFKSGTYIIISRSGLCKNTEYEKISTDINSFVSKIY